MALLVPAVVGGLAGQALAGWSTTRAAATGVQTATLVHPGGAAAPPAPSVSRAQDGSATLSWPGTVLSGEDPRPMTAYLVTAVAVEGGGVQQVACELVVAPTVTCSGVDAALAETSGFVVRPAYHWWVGPASAPSEPLPAEAPVEVAAAEPAPAPEASVATQPQPEPEPAPEPPGAKPVASDPEPAAQEPVVEEPTAQSADLDALFSTEPVPTVLLTDPPG